MFFSIIKRDISRLNDTSKKEEISAFAEIFEKFFTYFTYFICKYVLFVRKEKYLKRVLMNLVYENDVIFPQLRTLKRSFVLFTF